MILRYNIDDEKMILPSFRYCQLACRRLTVIGDLTYDVWFSIMCFFLLCFLICMCLIYLKK
jgi:hypothetical protein